MHIEFVSTQSSLSDGNDFSGGEEGFSDDAETSFSVRSRNIRRKVKPKREQLLVTGHLGITPAAVQGIVRIVIDPAFSAAHPHIASRPSLDVKLKGIVRTIGEKNTPFRSLQWSDNIILNESISFLEPFDVGLIADVNDTISMLMPGNYDIPFHFSLPNILPPSFSGSDGRVTYTLSAIMKFKEKSRGGGIAPFEKKISEPVVIRRYNSEHILSVSETIHFPVSTSVPAFDDEIEEVPSGSSRSLFSLSPVFSESSMSNHDFNPANLSPPAQNNSLSHGFTPNGIIQLQPPIALTQTRTGDSSIIQEFIEPATYSNLDSNDPVRYHIIVPSRSFGPDDLICVNLHISRLPEGFEVHHVNLIFRAEVSRKTSKGTKISTKILLHHRDIPENSGVFWNRKIQVPANKMFQKSTGFENENEPITQLFSPPSSSLEINTNDAVNENSTFSPENSIHENENLTHDIPESPILPTEIVTNEQPPPFEEVLSDFNIPRTFETRPLNRRAILIEALTTSQQTRNNPRETPFSSTSATPTTATTTTTTTRIRNPPIIVVAHDSGMSTGGNNSVFQPWVFGENSRNTSFHSLSTIMERTTSYGSISSTSAAATTTRRNSSRPQAASNSPRSVNAHRSAFHARVDTAVDNERNGDDLNENDEEQRRFLRIDPQHTSLNQTAVINIPEISFSPSLPPPPPPPPLVQPSNNIIDNNKQKIHNLTKLIIRHPLQQLLRKKATVPSEETIPLNTFTSPFLSVHHVLRIEIVCHKPFSGGLGSQLINVGKYQAPAVTNTPSIANNIVNSNRNRGLGLGLGSLNGEGEDVVTVGASIGKAFAKVVPVAFRHTTAIEMPVALHPASEKDRRFLRNYLYGPPPPPIAVAAGGGEERQL
ncbi:hypothetical protein HK100_005853 [Physocladia obscura]|uniref:Arrestin-like N-terminal domain-containing protein n=1 Tax=Physocladia obscura TaxID=109957 RepID=A0AAD5XC13_9FUNG|nr:hypothetical protein HK100_005853 [Physocladia obscura]